MTFANSSLPPPPPPPRGLFYVGGGEERGWGGMGGVFVKYPCSKAGSADSLHVSAAVERGVRSILWRPHGSVPLGCYGSEEVSEYVSVHTFRFQLYQRGVIMVYIKFISRVSVHTFRYFGLLDHPYYSCYLPSPSSHLCKIELYG